VEMLPSSTPATTTNLRDKRGVLEWAFEAKAGDIRDINFAWRMTQVLKAFSSEVGSGSCEENA
ncbi:hypothetical protein, partial [Bradyrhizobium brasilense]|uniref:hypothetical protein n=1 Tax=Bradyrhizobium brasilense TaxID=1419277 RepID=UPI00145720A8